MQKCYNHSVLFHENNINLTVINNNSTLSYLQSVWREFIKGLQGSECEENKNTLTASKLHKSLLML